MQAMFGKVNDPLVSPYSVLCPICALPVPNLCLTFGWRLLQFFGFDYWSHAWKFGSNQRFAIKAQLALFDTQGVKYRIHRIRVKARLKLGK